MATRRVPDPPARGGSTGGRTVTRAFAAMLALTLCAAAPAQAQYFGRNKVQVERFDSRGLPTEHFDIYYSPGGRGAALLAARRAERWYARLSKALAHSLSTRPP